MTVGRRSSYIVLGLLLALTSGTAIWSISTAPKAPGPVATSLSIPPPGPAGSGWDPDGGCGPQRRGCNWTPTFPHGSLELTDTNTFEAGSDFYATPLTINSSFSVTVSFDLTIGGGSDAFGTPADGATVDLLSDGVDLPVVGPDGGGLGWAGLNGVGVAFKTFDDGTKGTGCGDPSSNFVAIINGATCRAGSPCSGTCVKYVMNYFSGSSLPRFTSRKNRVSVTFTGAGSKTGTIAVSIDGHPYLTESDLTFPAHAYLGFTAAAGGDTSAHIISDFMTRQVTTKCENGGVSCR
jgi:hypothetical protein